MSNDRGMMTAQYGTTEPIPQNTSRLLRWLFRRFHVSREQFVSDLLLPGEALLDLGSGDGDFCARNLGKFKKIIGLDISPERVQRAAERYRDTPCTFRQQDLNQPLPFADNTFDAIASMVTLDWVYDLTTCLREVQRVLKPGGQFILEVNNLGYFVRRIKLLFGVYPQSSAFIKSTWPTIGWDASVCHYFTKKDLVRFMTTMGFSVKRVTGSGLFYQIRNWWPALLCGDLVVIATKQK